MPFPQPEPGLVISYSYLWRNEHSKGREEGRKIRPYVIVLAVEEKNGEKVVTVAPITHKQPHDPKSSKEIPLKVKQHLHLDDKRSWIILDEVNQFTWPGYDLQQVPGNKSRYDYGYLPPRLFNEIKAAILDLFMKRRARITERG